MSISGVAGEDIKVGLIQKLGAGQGYARIGFFGPEKSGKTRAAIDVLIGLMKYFNLNGPVIMYDTEGGSEYIAPYFKRQTGQDLLGVRSQSFADLMRTAKEAEDMGAVGFLVDSITHPSIEIRESYLKAKNDVLVARNKAPQSNLEFQDNNPVRARWAPWPRWFNNAQMHVIVCGRRQYEWTWEENDEGKKQLEKTGTRMRAENEFGYEPSLLIEMERIQLFDPERKIVHRAMVIADRFAESPLTGKTFDEPTWETWLPHIQLLTPGEHPTIDAEVKTAHEISEDGTAEWIKERRERVILCEEIQGELVRAWPGQTAGDKKAKTEAIETAFGTRSWTKVETFDAQTLRDGLEKIRSLTATATGSNSDDGEGA